jgi:hypothetical protein
MGAVSSIGPVGGIKIESVGSAMMGVASVGAGRHHMVATRGSEGSITGTEASSSGEDAENEDFSLWSQRGRGRCATRKKSRQHPRSQCPKSEI